MSADVAQQMIVDLLWTGLLVCLPVLGLTMLVGLLVSVFQVVTQIQEMSLAFVPKLVTAALVLTVFGPWIVKRLTNYMTHLWVNIPAMF